MKNRELIEKLKEFNLEAEVDVVAYNMPYPFSLAWGSKEDGEGTEKEETSTVSIYVDELCQNDRAQ